MRNKLLSVSLPAVFLLSSCGTKLPADAPPVTGSESRILVDAWEKQANAGLTAVQSPARIPIPIVIFKNPGAGFSEPEWEVSPAGAYSMYQAQNRGTSRTALSILASPGNGPALKEAPSVFSMPSPGTSGEEPREWKTVYVPALKKNIRYYLINLAAGDTHDQWATEIFTVGSASYRASVELTDSSQVSTLFARLAVKK
ncbi:hypothetical protein ACFSSA_02460 [Luteolibacter algae]|uniref:Lipoprotein n=1 Tax=Luteolibacter algae TaxID=454151 RepID=A0ABW5D6A8_9BACT